MAMICKHGMKIYAEGTCGLCLRDRIHALENRVFANDKICGEKIFVDGRESVCKLTPNHIDVDHSDPVTCTCWENKQKRRTKPECVSVGINTVELLHLLTQINARGGGFVNWDHEYGVNIAPYDVKHWPGEPIPGLVWNGALRLLFPTALKKEK